MGISYWVEKHLLLRLKGHKSRCYQVTFLTLNTGCIGTHFVCLWLQVGKHNKWGPEAVWGNSVWGNWVSGHIDSENLLLTFICCFILNVLFKCLKSYLSYSFSFHWNGYWISKSWQKASQEKLMNTWEKCNKYMQRCQTEWDEYIAHILVITAVHHAMLVSYPLLEYKCIFNVKMLNKRQHSHPHSITPCKTHYWCTVTSRNAQPQQHNSVFITNSVTHNHPSSSIFIVESPLSGSLPSPSLQLTRTWLWMKNFNLWSNQICTH